MSNELQHHGIFGMKWGIRRYQNKDGSLTPEGQKRYNTVTAAADYAGRKGNELKRQADDVRKQAEEYQNYYSGEEGRNRYRDQYRLHDLTDEQVDRSVFGDLEVYSDEVEMFENYAKNYLDMQKFFLDTPMNNIPNVVYNEAKAYLKEEKFFESAKKAGFRSYT